MCALEGRDSVGRRFSSCGKRDSPHRRGLRTRPFSFKFRRSSPRETDPQGGSEFQRRPTGKSTTPLPRTLPPRSGQSFDTALARLLRMRGRGALLFLTPLSRGGRGGWFYLKGGRGAPFRRVGSAVRVQGRTYMRGALPGRAGRIYATPLHPGSNNTKKGPPALSIPHRRERGAVPFSTLPSKSDYRIRRVGAARYSRSRLEDSNS